MNGTIVGLCVGIVVGCAISFFSGVQVGKDIARPRYDVLVSPGCDSVGYSRSHTRVVVVCKSKLYEVNEDEGRLDPFSGPYVPWDEDNNYYLELPTNLKERNQ